jgi:hypothetical protein
MAITSNTYTGNGSNKLFSITFPYLETTDVDVYLNGVLQTVTTQYTFANATTVEFVAAPGAGTTVLLSRNSDDTTLQATFFPGSSIKANDLNDNFDQVLYLAQETNNNVANAVAGQIPDGTITSSKIANDTIVDADVNSNAGILASKSSFTQSGTGATARTVENKLKDTVSVKDFGAVGNGVADDTTAIQAAIDAISAQSLSVLYSKGGTVYFPSGKYRTTNTIYLTKGIKLLGTIAGSSFAFSNSPSETTPGSTIVADFNTANKIVIDSVGHIVATGLRPSSTTVVTGGQVGGNLIYATHSAAVHNIRIAVNAGSTQPLTGIRMAGSPGFQIESVEITGVKHGIIVNASWGASISNVNIVSDYVGLALTNDVNNIIVDNVYTTVAPGPMPAAPYYYVTLDAGNPVINPTALLTQTTGVYAYYASGVINNIVTERSDIGKVFRNSSFTLNTPYAEIINNYWLFCYSSRLVITAAVPGIGNTKNLIYFAGGSNVDLSVSREIKAFFNNYVEFFDDTALCQVTIHEEPKSVNNYKTLKYVWSQENGQVRFLATPNNSTDPNVLDDYEEGTWTPQIRPDGSGTPWTATSSGRYTKIGNSVFVTASIDYTVKTGTGSYAYLTGIPFTPSANTDWNFATLIGGGANFYQLRIETDASGRFYKNNTSGAFGPLIGSELGPATGTISFAFTYRI